MLFLSVWMYECIICFWYMSSLSVQCLLLPFLVRRGHQEKKLFCPFLWQVPLWICRCMSRSTDKTCTHCSPSTQHLFHHLWKYHSSPFNKAFSQKSQHLLKNWRPIFKHSPNYFEKSASHTQVWSWQKKLAFNCQIKLNPVLFTIVEESAEVPHCGCLQTLHQGSSNHSRL